MTSNIGTIPGGPVTSPSESETTTTAQWLSGIERRGVGTPPPPRKPQPVSPLFDDRGCEFESPPEQNPYPPGVFVAPASTEAGGELFLILFRKVMDTVMQMGEGGDDTKMERTKCLEKEGQKK